MKADLIYDVGFYNGDDTAYYLYRGFRVVAIEANPMLVTHGQRRFENEIVAGRLTLLNVGVAESEGTFSFWVNEHSDAWSSFDKSLASRLGTGCHEVEVQGLPFSSILGEHGVPYYLKVDIEGSDALCVAALDSGDLPKYISCELTHDKHVINELYSAGYRRFKVLNQTTYTDSIPIFRDDIAARLLRKACSRLPPVRSLVRHLPEGLRPKRIAFDNFPSRFQYQFKEGSSSGPFGEDTYGRWYSDEEITARIAEVQHRYRRAHASLEEIWCDVHATW